eukprot:CAMPEP_0206020094 /NCGR_PEP_ID=MMETSP1464-20131121/30361_1 /ASSEMBLY_ACC=CAM_ASM_001124 /TAXON_ID=119497 /ORGANISM="Exanthemachrysis gayraliae, Strain RCC1523" /LENGTH=69 /DNA_ID=CAMNT_0053394017 /DNA_START=254 /DNA_END=459 /DNA_ORIENTATION=+
MSCPQQHSALPQSSILCPGTRLQGPVESLAGAGSQAGNAGPPGEQVPWAPAKVRSSRKNLQGPRPFRPR